MKRKKRKRVRFGEIKIGNDTIYVDKHKPLNFFVVEPFHQQRMNFYYLKLCHILQENTNRLCFEDLNGNIIPHHKISLINYLGVSRQYFDIIFRQMCHNGIIAQVKIFNIMEYYINPRFAFCGEEIPKFLLDMFRYDADKIFGEHIFDIKNTIYERRTDADTNDEN